MTGTKLKFIDLFCGAGGFTWGWARSGFDPVACVDNNPIAIKTHELNFSRFNCRTLCQDLGDGGVEDFSISLGQTKGAVDVIIGGPPCQGWSKVGRGKLRSLGKAGMDLLNDPRNKLYRRFIELVRQLAPAVCVMENVPGMLSIENRNIADAVRANFEDAGYRCTYSLVNARWFGVPQDRRRLIFIAVRNDLDHMMDATGLQDYSGLFMRDVLGFSKEITVADAIRDLPPIANGSKDDPLDYRRSPGRPNRYVRLMHEGADGVVNDHICRRYNDQDVEAFGIMHQGMKYHQLDQRFKRYRDDIFKDKYKKLIWDQPSWTVTAHLGKDCYTHIHPEQARTISVREAARLQSFPDTFAFAGSMGDRFRQIGNAVPPLMAWGIAEFVKEHLAGGNEK